MSWFCVENHTLNPNRALTRSLQARSSASRADSYRSISVCHQTHTPNSRTCQLGVSENHGLLDHHGETAQTMPSSVRGSALAFAVPQFGYSQGFLPLSTRRQAWNRARQMRSETLFATRSEPKNQSGGCKLQPPFKRSKYSWKQRNLCCFVK